MNINRHNYEEFFLLYVDNELSEAARTEVEIFAQQNPDLGKELQLLKESIVQPEENIQLLEKDALYKNEQSVNLSNYQEYFLLHIDNELEPKEKNEIEKFVLHHPELQNEFTILHRTKLKPEVIEFKDKTSLYKTEGKVRRIVPYTWMRIASAAVVIGIVALLWITNAEEKIDAEPVALNETKKEAVLQQTADNISPAPLAGQKGAVEVPAKQQVEIAQKKVPTEVKLPAIKKIKEERKSSSVEDRNLNQIPSSENNPVLTENTKKREANIGSMREDIPEKTFETGKPSNGDFAKNNSREAPAPITKQAVYRELDNNDEENTIFIAGAEINKNKLRGLFKKATTLLEKRLKRNDGDNDNTVQIAGFEIKTK